MTRPALAIVRPAPNPTPTYAEVPASARQRFADLSAKVRRIEASLSGSFSTTVKMAEAERELGEISALALSTQRSIRSGR